MEVIDSYLKMIRNKTKRKKNERTELYNNKYLHMG